MPGSGAASFATTRVFSVAWPVVVPIYLFQTRGVRAFLTLLCFAGIWLVAIIAEVATFLVREFLLD